MIEKTDFPYTLGGYVEQQNYKGFDIAVSIRRYKGISAYVISSEKRLIREESATFADKEDMFRWGREAVDRYLEQQERRKEENAVNCTCSYPDCPRKGMCCECVMHHRKKN